MTWIGSRRARVLLVLFVLFLIGFVIIRPIAKSRNIGSAPSSAKSVAAFTSTDSYLDVTSPIITSPGVGLTAFQLSDSSAVRSSYPMLPLTLQRQDDGTSQWFLPPQASENPIYLHIGPDVTALVQLTKTLIFLVVLVIFLILCQLITARRSLASLNWMILKSQYPNLTDPSKNFSRDRSLPIDNRFKKRESAFFNGL